MSQITNIFARQILDSRGNPTVEVDVELASGAFGRASVPSGASTGTYEAVEKRDGDAEQFNGKGVLTVVNSINEEIFQTIKGFDGHDQMHLDQTLCELDGTENKERLGANAILAVSLAVAKAAADDIGYPLYRYLKGAFSYTLPVPLMNVINGGAHADNSIDIQEFMIVPVGTDRFSGALQMGSEIFTSLRGILSDKGLNTNVGDEGGFAPNLRSTTEALDLLMHAIEQAGYEPGNDVGIALDVAASELYHNGKYAFNGENKTFDSAGIVEFYGNLIQKYPILSIEDPLAEDDWEAWEHMTNVLGNSVQIVGDDLFVTNIERIQKGAENSAANAVLIKPNQIGTLTETMLTIEASHRMGYATIISHRSGETEDTTIADIAVATNAGQIKTGSLSRTDRLSKYNQLLRIEEEIAHIASFPGINAFPRTYYK